MKPKIASVGRRRNVAFGDGVCILNNVFCGHFKFIHLQVHVKMTLNSETFQLKAVLRNQSQT